MTEIIKVGELSTQESITSLELVKQVNLFREQEGNRAELQHKTMLDIIRDEFNEEIGEQKILPTSYKDVQGKERPMFELSLSQARQVLVRESKFVRKAVIAYIDKLENVIKEQFKVPTTFREALLLAAEQQELIEKQQCQLQQQAPKVDFYDQVVDSKDTIDMGLVAKTLNKGIGKNKLFEILRDKKILMQNNVPYQIYIDKGWFRTVESKYTKPSGDICINIKTVVFQKGIDGILGVLNNFAAISTSSSGQ